MHWAPFRFWRYLFLTPLLGAFGILILWALGLVSFIITILVMSPASLTERADGIVVLTGGAERVRTGLELLQNRQGRELLISGVYRGATLSDLVKKADMQDETIPCCVTLGFQASDTVGNARETRTWVQTRKIKRLRLVTANYHMPRAWLEMRLATPALDIIPHPIRSPRFSIWTPPGFKLTLEEYHKTILVAGREGVRQGRVLVKEMGLGL